MKLLAALAIAGVLSGTPSLHGQALTGENLALVRRVDGHYNHLRTLQTAYSEHYSGMGMERTETGVLLLKRPGRMRWSYAEPVGKVFILDGRSGWFYTPGDVQAERIAAKQLDDLRSPLRFLLGHTQLEKELEGVAVRRTGDDFIITGRPKGMAERVKDLTLTVTATGAITGMRIEEVDGAVTEFRFSGMEENVPIADSEFHFKVPDGVTVVDGLPPI